MKRNAPYKVIQYLVLACAQGNVQVLNVTFKLYIYTHTFCVIHYIKMVLKC